MLVLANGMAGNEKIKLGTPEFEVFKEALHYINETLAKKMAGDGEGATALFEAKIIARAQRNRRKSWRNRSSAQILQRRRSLAMMQLGQDPLRNGIFRAEFDPEKVDLYFVKHSGKTEDHRKWNRSVDYSEKKQQKSFPSRRSLPLRYQRGSEEAAAWGCDLTHGYIDINADYRS